MKNGHWVKQQQRELFFGFIRDLDIPAPPYPSKKKRWADIPAVVEDGEATGGIAEAQISEHPAGIRHHNLLGVLPPKNRTGGGIGPRSASYFNPALSFGDHSVGLSCNGLGLGLPK